jgi:sulfur-carrier protein
MAPDPTPSAQGETSVTVRYWASARAAAGVSQDVVEVAGAVSLAELVERVIGLHEGSSDLAKVLHVCSVLVDGAQAGTRDAGDVVVRPGASVEFLPPFAGG